MGEFEHDYYFLDVNAKTERVLCMRCASPVREIGDTAAEIFKKYREIKIEWIGDDDKKYQGVIIVCAACEPIELQPEDYPKIRQQIIRGFEHQTSLVNLPMPNTFKEIRINGQIKEA